MTNGRYILDDSGEPVEEPDLLKWARWFGNPDNRTVVQHSYDDVRVSTVFLGLDHQFGDGPPVLWETMIFGGQHDGYCERYSSYEETVDGHLKACGMVIKEKGLTLRGRPEARPVDERNPARQRPGVARGRARVRGGDCEVAVTAIKDPILAIVLSTRFPSSGHVCVLRFRPTPVGKAAAFVTVFSWHLAGWCTDEEQYAFEWEIHRAYDEARRRNVG